MVEKKRYYDIDWLRILGILAIFLFHNARYFSSEDWHVKNFELDYWMSLFVTLLDQFIMPLFFVLSAIAIYYSLKNRNNTQFMRERVTRLLVPLGIGIFSHIILQVYIENLTQGRYSGTFWQFLPHYFDGLYGFGGNFAWMGLHLWYLMMLFVFSLLMLPLFQSFKHSQTITLRLADLVTKPYGVYLFIIPIFIVELLVSLFPDSLGRRDFGGWSPLTYLVFFLIGYILASDERYRDAIEDVRFISMAVSLLSIITAQILRTEVGMSGMNPVYLLLRATISWSCLLTLFGFASHHLNFSNRFQKYANKTVLPFYILHQTVIVVVGYLIVDWNLPVFPKYLFLMAVSFILIMAIYEIFIKRLNFMRLLFGMKG